MLIYNYKKTPSGSLTLLAGIKNGIWPVVVVAVVVVAVVVVVVVE